MTTDLYCVMGHPVAHSQSPRIHARFAELTGQHIHYLRRPVAPDQFAPGVQAFMAEGGRGCNITVPFKFHAAALTSHSSEAARLAQASNTLTFRNGQILADNTDGIGLVKDIEQNAGIELRGKRVLLMGAGGAAAGVLGPLIHAGPAHISVANRTPQRALALVARHQSLALLQNVELEAHALQGLAGQFDIIINGTASSLGGHPVPVDARVIKPGALARDGLGMLVCQAAEAFFIWRGIMPPARQVLDELRAGLAA
jgi:shikimate dehydrogenase